jgi:hypothetical protein
LFFVDSMKKKAEVPLSSTGMVLKVLLGTPETRYGSITAKVAYRYEKPKAGIILDSGGQSFYF